MELEWREYRTVPAGMTEIHRFDELPVQKSLWFVLLQIPAYTGQYQTYRRISSISTGKHESAGIENNKKKEEKVVIDSPLRSVATTSRSPVISPSPTGYFFFYLVHTSLWFCHYCFVFLFCSVVSNLFFFNFFWSLCFLCFQDSHRSHEHSVWNSKHLL